MKLFQEKKNNLDEMQEQKLLKLESRGFWLIWWALLAAMAVQLLVYGVEAYHLLLGEWVVFMLASVYMAAACIKQGLWDRKLKPNFRTNLLISLLAAVVAGGFMGVYSYRSFGAAEAACWTVALVGGCTFALCLLALSLSALAYKKRRQQLDEGEGSEE
ncbi:MAG: DUF6773 family protein [Candidatus Limivicinus sp.]|nr:DUF6773 family protein [Candidatus Limivicinus sp.]